MNNYYHLNIPCKILQDNIDLGSYPEFRDYHWAVWNEIATKYMTQEALDYCNSMGFTTQVWFDNKLQKDHVVIFRGNKGQFMDIHCDRGPTWCINIVWGSNKSDMVWYELKDDIDINQKMCSVGSPYYSYSIDGCVEIERTNSTGPILTRIDNPHNVINYDVDNYRWCLSIRDLSNKMSWEEAVEHFKPWIVE